MAIDAQSNENVKIGNKMMPLIKNTLFPVFPLLMNGNVSLAKIENMVEPHQCGKKDVKNKVVKNRWHTNLGYTPNPRSSPSQNSGLQFH